MFSFTLAESEQANCNYKLFVETKLSDLYKTFSKCKKGDKLGSGIIRGGLTDALRCDEYLEYSKLLIIDADSGIDGRDTPSVESCHEALKALGYNHFIYTTHSHKPEYHKYRAIVELNEEIEQHELHTNMSELINQLRAQGCALHYAHEMDTWSQIWFLPRSNNPDVFQSFGWFDGDEFPAIHIEISEAEKKSRSHKQNEEKISDGTAETLDEMYDNIYTGKEYHHSLRNLSYQLAKDGVSRAIILAQLRAVMNGSQQAGTERWESRMKDLERLVDGGIERAQDEEATTFELPENEETSYKYTPPPMPPGRLGKAISQCLETMPRPQIEFAFPMILGSIAAICGAKFNVYSNQNSGVNLSMTVVAGTGFGKGQINKFFNALFVGGLGGKIINLSGGDGAISFLGSNNYTAPKPLHKDLEIGRSRVICMQEAGIMLGAKSGNADELSAYIMENFINSDYNSFASTRAYSSDDNSLKTFRAPAMSLILESTEESLAKSLKDMNALESGFIPRQTMFKVSHKPPMNRDRSAERVYDFDDDVVSQYKSLITECAKVQAVPTFDVNLVSLTDDQFDEYCDIEENFADGYATDKVSKIMATRMSHKMIKFAAICSIFNDWTDGDMEVSSDAWEWAKQMAHWEMENINHNLSYMKSGNDYDYAIYYLKERVIAALHHKDTSTRQRMAKVVKKSVLMHRIGDAKIQELAGGQRMATSIFIDRTLKAMERMGLIRLLDGHPTCKRKNTACIQILEDMIDVV